MFRNRHYPPQQTLFWLLVCFTCSGMSGLIYEVAWVRSLELIFGATTFAVATVLAAFMGGLACGSYFMGVTAPRFARFHPLVIYGVIECLIGACAVAIPLLFKSLIPLYQSVWTHFNASFVWFSLLRFVLCAVILLVPTFLMGATLPVMSSFVGGESGEGEKRIGLLYAFNTFGAVLGCAGAGLILFPSIGLARTQWVAVALNVLAALGAFVLAGRLKRTSPAGARITDNPTRSETAPHVAADSDESVTANQTDRRQGQLNLLVAIYAVSGFSAMLYEVAWNRVLVLVLGSSTYAYTIMLTTFLLGLALGAYLATRFLSKTASPLVVAGLCQVMIALTTYLGMFLVEELPFLYVSAYELFRPTARGFLAVQFVLAMGLMILPTLGLGAMFPVTIHGLSPSGDKTARVVGWAYALNTGGAIFGSVMAGFWLVPQLGSRNTLLGGILLNALLGLFGILAASAGPLTRYRPHLASLIVLFIGNLFVGTPQWRPYVLSSGIFRYVKNYEGLSRQKFLEKLRENRGEILFFKEGLTCTITVCRSLTGLSLLVNGKPDASTPSGLTNRYSPDSTPRLGDLPTQILVGQIPLMLASNREEVLLIGLGSGVTLGSVLRHPVKQVECIELEEAVIQGSRFFDRYSGQPLNDPRVKLIVNDARNHLLVTDKQYDVIISEPSNPWIAGAASLFTREFFETAKSKLRFDGLFCQWLQLYELHEADFQTLLRSFHASFPEVHLFQLEHDAILIGSRHANKINLDRLQTRMTAPVLEDLSRVRINGLEDVLAYYWIGGQELQKNMPPGPVNTDDNMRIEFTAPLRLLVRHDLANDSSQQALANLFREQSTGIIPQLERAGAETDGQSQFWAKMAEGALHQQLPAVALMYADHSLKFARNPLAAQVRGEALSQTGQPEKARDWWSEAAREFHKTRGVLRAIVDFQFPRQDWPAARQAAENLLAEFPDDLPGRFLLGQSLYQLKESQASLAVLEPLQTLTTGQKEFQELAFYLGALYRMNGRNEEAIQQLQIYLVRNPNHATARSLLADSLTSVGRQAEALIHRLKLGQADSPQASARLREGKAAWEQGNRAQARVRFEEAWQLNPWDDEINFYLARARHRLNDVNAAIELLEKYLSWNPDRPWAIGYLSQLMSQQTKRERSLELAAYYHALTGRPWVDIRE